MRITLLAVAMALFASVLPVSAQAVMQHYQLNIPRQSLDTALKDFAHQTGLQIARFSDTIDGSAMVGPLSGELAAGDALKALLGPSGLSFKMVNDRTIAIVKTGAATSKPADSRTLSTAGDEGAQPDEGSRGAGSKEPFWSRFRVAQVDQGASATSPSVEKKNEQASEKKAVQLEEVIVTAQKRSERLQDVPVPVTVLSGDALAENNQTKIEDSIASVPGLSLFRNGNVAGGSTLEIRGLGTSGYQNGSAPTIGFMIDGMPYGPSQIIPDSSAAAGFPDIDPSDIDRIEVLKGPQGTLYGADSIGGLINIVTKEPSTAGFSAHVQGLGEDIPDGGAGYAVRGAVNVPISADLAARVSAFDRRDAGYIENVTNGQKNVNSADVYGGHLSLLYRPTEDFSFKLSALFQDDHAYGTGVINVNQALQPQLGNLQQTGLRGSGENEYQVQAYSGVLNARVSGINIVSTTAYNVQKDSHNWDFTGIFGTFVDQYFTNTAPNGSNFPSNWTNDKFSQEIRLSSSYGHWLDWVIGGFYTHESNSGFTYIDANNPATGAYIGHYYIETAGHDGDPPTTLSEDAAFGDVTFHITDRFDLQIGGRGSWYRQTHNHAYFGPGVPVFDAVASPDFLPTLHGSDQAFTYLITPEYKFSRDLMVYARIATGYEIGGTNASFANFTPPGTYGPAKTTNYEIGAKGTLADGRLIFDASVYYIDWTGIQIAVFSGFDGYIINAGRAKSQGIEASIQARPVDGLRITAAGSYNDAKLTQNFPANAGETGPAGTQLPYSMHWSGSVTADWDAAHFGDKTAFIGGTVSYVGERPGEFSGELGTPRLIFPAYTTVGAHIGVRAGTLDANLYVKNLGNTRGLTGGSTSWGAEGNTAGFYAQVIQPRTVGLSLSKHF